MTAMGASLDIIRDWANTGAIMGLLGLATRHFFMMRKLHLAEKKDDREGWGTLIAALQADVASVREDLTQARQEHINCETRMNSLRSEINGLNRQMIALSRRYGFPLEDNIRATTTGEI